MQNMAVQKMTVKTVIFWMQKMTVKTVIFWMQNVTVQKLSYYYVKNDGFK